MLFSATSTHSSSEPRSRQPRQLRLAIVQRPRVQPHPGATRATRERPAAAHAEAPDVGCVEIYPDLALRVAQPCRCAHPPERQTHTRRRQHQNRPPVLRGHPPIAGFRGLICVELGLTTPAKRTCNGYRKVSAVHQPWPRHSRDALASARRRPRGVFLRRRHFLSCRTAWLQRAGGADLPAKRHSAFGHRA